MLWFKKKQPVVEPDQEIPEPEVKSNPKLSFEMTEDGQIQIQTLWPEPDDERDKNRIIAMYAYLLFLLKSGKIMPTIKNVIESTASDKISREISRGIINTYQGAIKQAGLTDGDDPLISPEHVFAVRGRDD